MTRRDFFSHLISTATGSPTPRAARADHSISPRMAQLIAEFRHREADLSAIDDAVNPIAWDAAADLEIQALKALLAESPRNIAEFTAKLETLLRATENDTELHILRVLAADVRTLVEAGR
jgi:hypothetical protein